MTYTLELALERIKTLEAVQASLQARIGGLVRRIDKLRPSPKYRVGQVVRWGQGYYRIIGQQYNLTSPHKCEYDLGGRWVFEEHLAALTGEERGL